MSSKTKVKHNLVPEAKWGFDDKGGMSLHLPDLTGDLPTVSVVTVTSTIPYLFLLSIHMWSKFVYPHNNIEWIVYDDGEVPIGNMVTAIEDKRVRYIRAQPGKQHSNGTRRNSAIEYAKNDLIVLLEPNTFYFPDSIIAKARVLLHYNKRIVYSPNLGMYHLTKDKSFIAENFKDIPVGSLAFTKTFWNTHRFDSQGDGLSNFIKGKESRLIKLPFWFNLVSCVHDDNFPEQNESSDKPTPSFYELVFDHETRGIVDTWREMHKDQSSTCVE